jgi:outer membrane lipoprotein-sorting protein
VTFRLMLFVFLCTASVAAQDHLTPPEVLQKVQQKYTGISTATASFTQKMTLRFGRNEQLQSGSVKIKHGNRFLVNTPDQQLIANGTSV